MKKLLSFIFLFTFFISKVNALAPCPEDPDKYYYYEYYITQPQLFLSPNHTTVLYGARYWNASGPLYGLAYCTAPNKANVNTTFKCTNGFNTTDTDPWNLATVIAYQDMIKSGVFNGARADRFVNNRVLLVPLLVFRWVSSKYGHLDVGGSHTRNTDWSKYESMLNINTYLKPDMAALGNEAKKIAAAAVTWTGMVQEGKIKLDYLIAKDIIWQAKWKITKEIKAVNSNKIKVKIQVRSTNGAQNIKWDDFKATCSAANYDCEFQKNANNKVAHKSCGNNCEEFTLVIDRVKKKYKYNGTITIKYDDSRVADKYLTWTMPRNGDTGIQHYLMVRLTETSGFVKTANFTINIPKPDGGGGGDPDDPPDHTGCSFDVNSDGSREYYDGNGDVTDAETYRNECVKTCKLEGSTYYCKSDDPDVSGPTCSYETYVDQCVDKGEPCSKKINPTTNQVEYYNTSGSLTTQNEYRAYCVHVCSYSDGQYYCKDDDGDPDTSGTPCDYTTWEEQCTYCGMYRKQCTQEGQSGTLSQTCKNYWQECPNCNPSVSIPETCTDFDTNSYLKGTISDINLKLTSCNFSEKPVKKCVIGGTDFAGNEFIMNNVLNNNKYCKVYCYEQYSFSLPTAQHSTSGGYFNLSMSVEGTRNCYLGTTRYSTDLYRLFESTINGLNRNVEKVYVQYQETLTEFNKIYPKYVDQYLSYKIDEDYKDLKKLLRQYIELTPKYNDLKLEYNKAVTRYNSYVESLKSKLSSYLKNLINNFEKIKKNNIKNFCKNSEEIWDLVLNDDFKYKKYGMTVEERNDCHEKRKNYENKIADARAQFKKGSIEEQKKYKQEYNEYLKNIQDFDTKNKYSETVSKYKNLEATYNKLLENLDSAFDAPKKALELCQKENDEIAKKGGKPKSCNIDTPSFYSLSNFNKEYDEIRQKVSELEEKLMKFQNDINNEVSAYNDCTKGDWQNNMVFDPLIKYQYNDYSGSNYNIGTFNRVGNVNETKKNTFCFTQTDGSYNCLGNGGLVTTSDSLTVDELKRRASELSVSVNDYISHLEYQKCEVNSGTSTVDCRSTELEVMRLAGIEKSVTKSATYMPLQNFNTYHQYGTVKTGNPCTGTGYNNCLWTRLPDTALPVELKTGKGAFPFKITVSNIGQYSNGSLGRLIGNSNSVLNNYNSLPASSKCSVYDDANVNKKNYATFTQDVGYVCAYINNCDECGVGCTGSGCSFKCQGNCPTRCRTCIFDGKNTTFKYRSISLNNIFPNSCTGTNTTNCRKEGYNWTTEKAVQTKKEIEEAGNQIYENAQYSYTLNPSQMNAIKDYNRRVGGYGNMNTLTSNDSLIGLQCQNLTSNGINYSVKCLSTFLNDTTGTYFTTLKRDTNFTLWKEGQVNPYSRADGIGPSWK